MKLLTKSLRERLLKNGRIRQALAQQGKAEADFIPVVKLFTPDGAATWLLTEIDPGDYDRCFGLCDLGLGYPELGYVSLAELQSVRGKLGLAIERDRWFVADKTISRYAAEAAQLGRINA